MWFLVTVVKGNRYYEADSQIGNRVLVSDSTDMVIAGSASGMSDERYRFEARRANETYIVGDFAGKQTAGALTARFLAMAQQMGAIVVDNGVGALQPA
jgi:hypothetical protein